MIPRYCSLLQILLLAVLVVPFVLPLDSPFPSLYVTRKLFNLFKIKSDIATGTLKWFDESGGFGFISRDDGGDDVCVHCNVIHGLGFKIPAEGLSVTCAPGIGPKDLPA